MRQNQMQIYLNAKKKTLSSRYYVEKTQTRLIYKILHWKREHNANQQFDDEQKFQKNIAWSMKTILKQVLNDE
jgi:hypothetical protein